MGVYSVSSLTESVIDLSAIEERHCDINLGDAYMVMAECETTYNNILKAIGIAEFNTYETTGKELIYENATFDAFIEKIKQFFTSFLAKVGAIVKSFKDLVASWVQKDESFLKAHEAELKAIKSDSLSKLNYIGWKFNDSEVDNTSWVGEANDAITNKVAFCGSYDDICTLLGKGEDGFSFDREGVYKASENLEYTDSIRNEMAGALVGKETIDSSDLNKALHNLYYASAEKEELTINISEQIEYIRNTKKLSDTASKTFKEVSDAVSAEIKQLNKLKSELKSKAKYNSETYSVAVSLTNKVTTLVKYRLNLINMRNTSQMEALKTRNSQARSICVKALTSSRLGAASEKGKKTEKPAETKQEGFTHYTESGTFFDAVKIL